VFDQLMTGIAFFPSHNKHPPTFHFLSSRPLQAWIRVFDQLMTGIAFFHLMMVALLGVKSMPGPAILCAILWLFDAAFW